METLGLVSQGQLDVARDKVETENRYFNEIFVIGWNLWEDEPNLFLLQASTFIVFISFYWALKACEHDGNCFTISFNGVLNLNYW